MIAVVDYGMGNLGSVVKACRLLGARVRVTDRPADIRQAKGVIFPGVGAFGAAMRELRRRKLLDPLRRYLRADPPRPFLGLCLGMQLLFDSSEESPGVKGLGLFPGRVRRFPARRNLKVPHMGWNQIERRVRRTAQDPLLRGVPDGAFMYFVHSFYVEPHRQDGPGGVSNVSAWTRYGLKFPSVYWNSVNIWATQFHPEKSQRWGLRILKNFIKECAC